LAAGLAFACHILSALSFNGMNPQLLGSFSIS
jgi:hypothetical protein